MTHLFKGGISVLFFQLSDDVMCPCVQPDQSIMERFSCLPVPGHGRLSLIRNTNCLDVGGPI